MTEDGDGRRVLAAAVDRIEEGRAVIAIVGGGELLLPQPRLPEGAGEGACLKITLQRDPDREAALRGRTSELQRRLLEMTREAEDGEAEGGAS